MTDTLDWMTSAACRGHDTEIFFSPDPRDIAAAKLICANCPVTRACAEYQCTTKSIGTWAGLTDDERNGRPAPEIKPITPITHGTDKGYRQHRRRGETPCRPCTDAHAFAAWERANEAVAS